MLYLDFEAGNKAYKLRLNTRATVALEKAIGCSALGVFGDGSTLPTVETMVHILHCALQPYEHNMTLDKAFEIFDDYIADGKTPMDFIQVIMDLYEVSGIIKINKEAEEVKNA